MKVTDILMQEHQCILQQLEKVNILIENPVGEVVDQYEALVEFIVKYADHFHHAKEENIYFQWMRSENPLLDQGPLYCMLAEHNSGRELIKKVKNNLDSFKNGEDCREEVIKKDLLEFTYALKDHIFKEDSVLYKMAEQLNQNSLDGDLIMLPQFEQVREEFSEIIKKYE